jgi:hypothetical protein
MITCLSIRTRPETSSGAMDACLLFNLTVWPAPTAFFVYRSTRNRTVVLNFDHNLGVHQRDIVDSGVRHVKLRRDAATQHLRMAG